MTIDDICAATTVVLPTSPRPSHPDTRIIDETLRSVRFWFPTAPVEVLCDGIRPEFESRRGIYHVSIDNLIRKKMPNVNITAHSHHRHQAAMVKEKLPDISTPLILWIEDDLPIITDADRPIDWQMMAKAITSGVVELVRLMLTETIHPLHEYLYSGLVDGYPQLLRNRQYSGWTHLASTEFYRRMLANFDTRAKMTVERYVYGFIENSGDWNKWKMASYIPDPERAKRIRHLDGRAGPGPNGTPRDPSFEEQECYPPRG